MAAPTQNMCDSLFRTVFQSYLSKQSGNIALKHVTGIFESNQLLSSLESGGSMQEMTSHIHGCLGNSKQRVEGLLLLSALVKQCTTDVFQQNALTWIKLLTQILQSHCPLRVYSASCQVLGEIIQFSKTFSDLSREITTSVIPQILPVLINAPAEVIPSAASCISKCIRTYPGPVGPYKNKLEVLILQQLDKSLDVEAVHRCYALLCQCGPGGSGGIKHAEAWSIQGDKLIGSLESTIDALYDGLESESFIQRKEGVSMDLSSIDFDRGDRVTALVARWKTLTDCLVYMLSEEMYTTVKVRADVILQLVYKCLSISAASVLQRPTTERSLLAAYIPQIHGAALDVLKQLIVLCRKNLVLHCGNVVSVLCQELVCTQTSNHGYNKQYGCLRQKVYDVLTTWLKALDGCSGVVLEETTLVKQILQDCAPYSDTLQLTADNSSSNRTGDMPSKKSKKKKKGYQEISQGISTQRKVHHLCNSELVTAALDALFWLVTTAGSEMSGKKLQEVQGFIIQTLFLVQQCRDFPVPYSSTCCRKGLYKVLQACVLTPHPKSPPPIQCALQLFSSGSLDKCLEVSALCLEASRICEVIIHPRAPCLNGPVVCENLVYIGRSPVETSVNTVFSGRVAEFTENDTERSENLVSEKTPDYIDIETNGKTNTGIKHNSPLKRKRQATNKENGAEKEGYNSKQLRLGSGKIDDKESDNAVEKNKDEADENITDKDLDTVETVVIDEESDSDVDNVDVEVNMESESGTDVELLHDKDSAVIDSETKKKGDVNKKKMRAGHVMVEDSLNGDTDRKPGTSRQEVTEIKPAGQQDNKDEDSDKDDEVVRDKASEKDDSEIYQTAEEPDEEVVSMMSAFVDAGPDSD